MLNPPGRVHGGVGLAGVAVLVVGLGAGGWGGCGLVVGAGIRRGPGWLLWWRAVNGLDLRQGARGGGRAGWRAGRGGRKRARPGKAPEREPHLHADIGGPPGLGVPPHAPVEVHPRRAGARELERGVGGPQRGAERLGQPRAPAVDGRVGLGDAEAEPEVRGGGLRGARGAGRRAGTEGGGVGRRLRGAAARFSKGGRAAARRALARSFSSQCSHSGASRPLPSARQTQRKKERGRGREEREGRKKGSAPAGPRTWPPSPSAGSRPGWSARGRCPGQSRSSNERTAAGGRVWGLSKGVWGLSKGVRGVE